MTNELTNAPASTIPTEDPALTVAPMSKTPDKDAVVTVMKGSVGAHTGLLYVANDDGARRHLHLAWHFLLKDDEAPPADAFWVEPHLDDLALADLRTSAHLIAKRHEDGRVPYALRPVDAHFSIAGALQLNKSLGLTCATFVILVFAHARIHLVETTTWEHARSPERKLEDDAAQSRLVGYLRKEPDAQKHADLVEADIGCTRIRAEEVAAASGMVGHPITFGRAEPQGRRVLRIVHAPIAPAEPQPEQSPPAGNLAESKGPSAEVPPQA